jgi:GTP-binding protein
VIVRAERSIHTLLDFKFRQHHKAYKGGHASSKGKTGRNGKDSILRVPIGTIIRDQETDLLIKDLSVDQQSVVVAKGGEGGIGNARRKTRTPPESGQRRTIGLELKLVADVGIVGFPNAGKSTLISNISRVKSKIASYPFTTKQPILGIVEDEDEFSFIVADLPGIIEGAHEGKGLGDRFLRHAERTRILMHLIDMSGSEGRDPLDDYRKIDHELDSYGDTLAFKHKLVVANKMDLPEAEGHLARFKMEIKEKVLTVSALEKEGLEELVSEIKGALCPENSQEK